MDDFSADGQKQIELYSAPTQTLMLYVKHKASKFLEAISKYTQADENTRRSRVFFLFSLSVFRNSFWNTFVYLTLFLKLTSILAKKLKWNLSVSIEVTSKYNIKYAFCRYELLMFEDQLSSSIIDGGIRFGHFWTQDF